MVHSYLSALVHYHTNNTRRNIRDNTASY